MSVGTDRFASAAPVAALAIPRYIRNLNAIAERAGMRVTINVTPVAGDGEDDPPELHLQARWEGTLEQLAATGLLVPHTMKRLAAVTRSCELCVPSGNSWHTLLMGEARVSNDQVVWDIDFGPMLYSIEQRGDVEIVTYPWELVFHGSAEALMGAGIARKHLPTGERVSKSTYDTTAEHPEPRWRARRQPDGLYVYRRESDEVCRIRCEQEAARRRELEQLREREEQARRQNEPQPAPANAAEWKARKGGATLGLIFGAKGMLERLREADERFRFDPADLERLSAMVMRSVSEVEVAVAALRVIDAREARAPLRLVVNNSRVRS